MALGKKIGEESLRLTLRKTSMHFLRESQGLDDADLVDGTKKKTRPM